ncbi:acyl-CoA thioesterase [Planobispora longispora]|uniref:4-hydroxybenzoyl-CoA thioesterase n=1 Tax=Planobispora longispora TaxID=28887 RepID=A0A8J3W5Z3_9ACTN|nr:thioesterase family protein [Planobispora longispora]GIH76983.1 4-hydroxybenzoyl-CoA thioesterase [Planobispora longispora]
MADGTTATPAPGDVYAQRFTPRFYEIDGQGVMFNMWYLAYVDEAVDGFFAHRGVSYSRWKELGIDVHIAHVDIDWKSPIRGEDRPEVLISTARIGKKSFTLDFAFRRDGELTATGSAVYVAFAPDGSGTVPVPDRLIEALGPVLPLDGGAP